MALISNILPLKKNIIKKNDIYIGNKCLKIFNIYHFLKLNKFIRYLASLFLKSLQLALRGSNLNR